MSVQSFRLLGAACVMSLLMLIVAGPAEACGLLVRITYEEDFPDRFHVEFVEGADYELTGLELDLRPAVGSPFIDMAYPESRYSRRDGITLTETEGLRGGSRKMGFKFSGFSTGKQLTLLVDLDGRRDRLQRGELFDTRAAARFLHPDGTVVHLNGAFNSRDVAELGNRACV